MSKLHSNRVEMGSMTTTQRDALSSPSAGTIIYNSTLGKGQIDIEGIVKKATQQGAKYFFIEDESSLVLDQVPLSLKFLNSIN